jgi:SAM-dependent methyltransferase
MSDPQRILSDYFQLMNLNGAAHVYREAVRSGVLEAIVASPRTAAELAEACALDARPLRLLLEVLAVLGLVTSDSERYRPTALAFMLLSGSYKHLGDEYWSHLPALLKTGQPLVKMDQPAQSETHYQAQAAMLGWMLTPAAQCAAEKLRHTLPERAAILDLGAGSAVWSLTLAAQTSDATVTAVDWPGVLAVAVETAESLGLSDRLTTIAGNYHEVDLPRDCFDLAILANVTHLEMVAGNRALLAKARAALKPQSRIVIVDALPGLPQGDLNRCLYALGLALRTEHGHVYSVAELESLLREGGFSAPCLTPLPVPPYVVGMLTASV